MSMDSTDSTWIGSTLGLQTEEEGSKTKTTSTTSSTSCVARSTRRIRDGRSRWQSLLPSSGCRRGITSRISASKWKCATAGQGHRGSAFFRNLFETQPSSRQVGRRSARDDVRSEGQLGRLCWRPQPPAKATFRPVGVRETQRREWMHHNFRKSL